MNNAIKHPCGILGGKQFKKIYGSGGFVSKQVIKDYKHRALVSVDIGPYGSGKGHDEFTGDCMQAYLQVLSWLCNGGDLSGPGKCREIVLAWSNTCETFKGANSPLEMAWGISPLVRSVEILKWKWKDGWKPDDDKVFNRFIDKIALPNLIGRFEEVKKWKNNWIFTIIEALIQIYMYRDDVDSVNKLVIVYKDLLKQCIQTCGCNTENKRDMIHCQFQLASQIQIAEMLWHQGVDLYDPLMLVSMEYQARILNGEIPCELKKEDIKDNWFLPSSWEIGYNHYVNRKKKIMPHTSKLLSINKPEVTMSFNWGPGILHKDSF